MATMHKAIKTAERTWDVGGIQLRYGRDFAGMRYIYNVGEMQMRTKSKEAAIRDINNYLNNKGDN